MKKVLVLLSGGIDSCLCLDIAIRKYGKENVYSLSFNYGQKNDKELNACKEISEYYDVPNKIINISNLFDSEACSLLKKSNLDIPDISYDEQVEKNGLTTSTNVPYRNGIMLSICAGYALSNNIDLIYYGIHTEEGVAYDLYPDCGDEFNSAINKAIYIGSGNKVTVEAPLNGLFKQDIIKMGLENKIPFEKTWTCYNNGDKACGKCCACTDRIKGFLNNNSKDPIEYEG